MSVCKLILIGNLGQDPELKESGDTKYCRFSIATEHYKEDVEWHSCVAFGKQAETIAKHCHKGQPLYVEGRLKTKEYEGKKTTSVIVENFSFVGGGQKKEETKPKDELPF